MKSVAHLEMILKQVLEERANQLARESGFLKRARKLSGADFVQALVFGWWHHPSASLTQLTQALAHREVNLTESALHQRFSPEAASFLQAVLAELVCHSVPADAVPIELLSRFEAVLIEDSTQINLPNALSEIWRGRGGQPKQTEATLKVHIQYDLLHGLLSGPSLSSARLADQRSPLRQEPLGQGVLYLADEGYYGLKWLARHAAQGGYFLTRPKSSTVFLDERGSRLEVSQIGPQTVGQCLDLMVHVGKHVQLPVRLILVRVSEEVAEQRRERIRRTAQQHGREVKERQLVQAQWTILITNVPASQLSVSEAVVLSRARWQIECLFRLWKEHLSVDEWRSKQPWRILCEVYAKLIAVLIQHWCLVQATWQQGDRSLVKASKLLADHALRFIETLRGESSLSCWLLRLFPQLARCRLDRRRSHPNLFQLLTQGLDWGLT